MHYLEFALCPKHGAELQEFAFQHTCPVKNPIACSYAASQIAIHANARYVAKLSADTDHIAFCQQFSITFRS